MTLPVRPAVPGLSGERFAVRYWLAGSEADARALAEAARVEQSVEFPAELIPEGDIRDHITGRLEGLERSPDGGYLAAISFAVETTGRELPQLLNLCWGTGSFFGGFRVERLDLPEGLLALYRGPRFGIAGLRERLQVHNRPLLCTAIKPLGLSPAVLADMAYRCALGGMDIIKDDHELSDQAFCPFRERVARCAEAVEQANRETGYRCVYAPNVTAPAGEIVERALYARGAGAGALLISPAITGFDAMRQLADDDRIALPILSHPTFTGHFVVHPHHGFSHYAFYGQIHRLAGADCSIFINYGGRFQVRESDGYEARDGCRDRLGHLKPIFPAPGGGMSRERIPHLVQSYGNDTICLVGGALHRMGRDLTENVRALRRAVEAE